jgi:hypothetical protein
MNLELKSLPDIYYVIKETAFEVTKIFSALREVTFPEMETTFIQWPQHNRFYNSVTHLHKFYQMQQGTHSLIASPFNMLYMFQQSYSIKWCP